jgi:DNA-directed RNA polymerase subunit M/transcription elongation factor TFIIS
MEIPNPALESLRLADRYRQLSDAELLALARTPAELTDLAQQALAGEMSARGLKLPPEERRVALPRPEPPPDSPYAEDRELVEACTVWSLRDALQLQNVLDRAGIPFFMGPEKATGVDMVASNFAAGLSVRVMSIGLYAVRQALQNYFPLDEPEPQPQEETKEIPVACPRCHSTEVIFESLTGEEDSAIENRAAQDPSSKYQWSCGDCGYEWEDDGILQE